MLNARPDWNIVAEACDGREAIEKAIETDPDIILLDLEMPNLNGIQAAKIIRQRCPKSKILFLTQDGDVEVRNAAMKVGASGYVLKMNAGKELLDAITTALCP